MFEPTLIFDDLRRSAVRNLDRAGVSQVVAMSITGHKTVSVYHRYRVVRIDDQRRALEQAHAVIESGPNVVPMTRREAAER